MFFFSAISTENKGRKLLAKMGWKEGESLGKSTTGITEPVSVSTSPLKCMIYLEINTAGNYSSKSLKGSHCSLVS